MPRDVAMRRSLSPEGVEHEFVYGRGIEAATSPTCFDLLCPWGETWMPKARNRSPPRMPAMLDANNRRQIRRQSNISQNTSTFQLLTTTASAMAARFISMANQASTSSIHRDPPDFHATFTLIELGLTSLCHRSDPRRDTQPVAQWRRKPKEFLLLRSRVTAPRIFFSIRRKAERHHSISSPTGWSTDRRSAVVIRGQRLESNSSKLALPRSKVGRPHSQIVAQAAKRVLIGTTVRSKCD